MNKIYVVGLGPGDNDMMTLQAQKVLNEAETIIGYPVYLDLIKDRYPDKEYLSTPMKKEVDRCRMCFENALQGKTTALVCSGDAGVYGMASLIYELAEEYRAEKETVSPDGTEEKRLSDRKEKSNVVEIEIIPGITAALSGAAVLGAPLNHDFCVISLSDLLTPWELIEKRITAACDGDFAIALYNPSSKKRHDYLKKACQIMLDRVDGTRACGYVKNIGRDGNLIKTCTLQELADEEVDMFTTVFIGNSRTRILNGKLVTPRGYLDKYEV